MDMQCNENLQHVWNTPPCQPPTPLEHPPPPFPPPVPIALQGSEKVWRGVFMGRFGLPSKNQETAHKLAGSWQVSRQMLLPNPLLAKWGLDNSPVSLPYIQQLTAINNCTPKGKFVIGTYSCLLHTSSPAQCVHIFLCWPVLCIGRHQL
jgi:hypothetical protein